MITPCPQTPNCVSSLEPNRSGYVKPLRFSGDIESAQSALLNSIAGLKRVRIAQRNGPYIRAEFTSRVFRFIDDVEFFFDDNSLQIHVKSASRVGIWDLGMNRRRIEMIRHRFNERMKYERNRS